MQLLSLILPSKSERKRATLVSHKFLAYYSVFTLLLMLSFNTVVYKLPQVLGYATNVSVSELLKYTNSVRESKGLNDLKLNEELSKAAKSKAENMFKENYWAHTSPSGKEPWDFIISSGYDYFYAGENLAVDFDESKDVVDAWYNSPSHKDNLVNKNYVDIGFAIVNGELQGRKTTLIVQMFGSPRNKVSVQNRKNDALLPSIDNVKDLGSREANDKNTIDSTNFETIPPVENLFIKDNKAGFQKAVLSSQQVFNASKYIAIIMGLLLSILFALDGYYIRKIGAYRITGHTMLHVLALLLVIIGIWYTNVGLIL